MQTVAFSFTSMYIFQALGLESEEDIHKLSTYFMNIKEKVNIFIQKGCFISPKIFLTSKKIYLNSTIFE